MMKQAVDVLLIEVFTTVYGIDACLCGSLFAFHIGIMDGEHNGDGAS